MATVYITVGQVGARGNFDSVMVFLGDRARSETITSSAATAPGALVAIKGDVAQVVCASAVYAMSDATPVATLTNGTYCPANTPTYIAMKAGHKVAVIDAV